MKKTVLSLVVFLLTNFVVFSQEDNESKTVFEAISGIKKKTDRFNLFLNMKSGFTSGFGENGLENPRFNLDQIRIEARGNISDNLAYRWRQRLNRSNYHGGMVDNAPYAIDFAYIAYKFSPKFVLLAGKQAAAFGGIEYDLNPIEVYAYSRILEGNLSGFMTGLSLYYQFTDKHELVFQALNSLNESFDITYSHIDKSQATTLPLVYTMSWNGSFFDNKYNTRWSGTYMSQTKKKDMFFIALGNQFDFSSKLNMYFDIMYSKEGVDRRSTITDHINKGKENDKKIRALDVDYLSFVSRLNYKINPKLNLFVKGMFENFSLTSKKNLGLVSGNYLSSIGYQCGLEFFPMDDNLRFAASYMGRAEKFRGSDQFLLENAVFIGFVYQIPMF